MFSATARQPVEQKQWLAPEISNSFDIACENGKNGKADLIGGGDLSARVHKSVRSSSEAWFAR